MSKFRSQRWSSFNSEIILIIIWWRINQNLCIIQFVFTLKLRAGSLVEDGILCVLIHSYIEFKFIDK